jgi:hypothetical protein
MTSIMIVAVSMDSGASTNFSLFLAYNHISRREFSLCTMLSNRYLPRDPDKQRATVLVRRMAVWAIGAEADMEILKQTEQPTPLDISPGNSRTTRPIARKLSW